MILKYGSLALILSRFTWLAKKKEILELFSTIEFDPDYDYKQQRNRP